MKRIFFIAILFFTVQIFSQGSHKNNYGLNVIADLAVYENSVKNDSNKILVDLEKFIPV